MKSFVNTEFDQTSFAGDVPSGATSFVRKLPRPTLCLAALVFGWLMAQDAAAAILSRASPLITVRGGQTATLFIRWQAACGWRPNQWRVRFGLCRAVRPGRWHLDHEQPNE